MAHMSQALIDARAAVHKKRMASLPLLIVAIVLILFFVVSLFSLSGKALRFDAAYASGGDLSPYFFSKLEEGQSYNFLQQLWLWGTYRRVWVAVAGILCFVAYVIINRDLLYNQNIAPYVFVCPFIITFLVFFLYPLCSTIIMSFEEITGDGTTWIGLKNYENMFGNAAFYTAVGNSLRYMFWTCILLIPFPLLFAYMLNSKTMKWSKFFQTLYYVPVLCSVVVAGIIFRMMFSELPGSLMNKVLTMLGGEPIAWMKYSAGTTMFAMVLLCCWRWTGMNILYYMAGIKSIPADLYEAADIDGANAIQKFLHVGMPLLKPTAVYVLTISIYAGLSMFTESMMIFGTNSSPKNYGLTIVGYLYRYGFEKVNKFGFASAVGLVLLAIAMIITVIQLCATGTIGRRKEG